MYSNKLARAKPPGPKQRLEDRDYDWQRTWALAFAEKRPTHAELWWAKRFLRRCIVDPLVKRGRGWEDERPMAERVLAQMEEKWPTPKCDYKPKKPVVKKKAKKKSTKKQEIKIKVWRCLVRGINEKIVELEPKQVYWERKFNKLKFWDAKWKETNEKVQFFRSEISRLMVRRDELKKLMNQ